MRMSVPITPPAGVSADEFRDVISHFATGVTVITAVDGGERFGSTASAVSSLSLDPPMLLVCLNRESSTGACVSRAGRFAVNILGESQGELAKRFASKAPDKFAGVTATEGGSGEPLLDGALAHVECRVVEEVSGGTHLVFLAEVERAEAGIGTPLAYYRGEFGRLELAGDERAYTAMRALVVGRQLPIGAPLDLEAIARDADVPRNGVHQGLARLVGDGIVERDGNGSFVVPPLTFDVVEDAFRGRCAAQLGAAALSVGNTSDEDLAELRRLMEATKPRRADGSLMAMDEWFDANQTFHLAMIRLAGSDVLMDAYERFTVPGLMTRSLSSETGPPDDIAEDHVRIVDSYEQGDLAAAMDAIRNDYLRALDFNLDRLRAAGGRL
jgi:flavin reductase (DIM6/NTAB) family NADH-FMN oxidoreductase RutF/DNA-binding GntR family transcriptional regulator